MSDSSPIDLPRTYRILRIPADVVSGISQHKLLTNLYPTRVGFFPAAANHFVERETMDEFIAIYCVAGAGRYTANSRSWPVGPGDFLVVFPGTSHIYEAARSDPWTVHWAHFDGSQALALLEFAGITRTRPIVQIGERLRIVTLFVELLNTLQLGYSINHLLSAAASLRQIISQVGLAHRYAPVSGQKDVHVERTIDFMLSQLSESLSLDDLASQAALSRSHFARRFQEKTGYTPIDYFIRLKIQRAGEMLEGSALSVTEISRQLGYNDPYYFSRIFKKITGVSPSHYRAGRS